MAMLTRWDPHRELARVQEEMNRTFGDERQPFRAGESVGWTPACDIYEDGEEIVVRAERAGVGPEDVEIRYEKRENHHRVHPPKKPEAKPKSIQVKVS